MQTMKQKLWLLHQCIHCIGVMQADFAACTYDKIAIVLKAWEEL
jgi:hypothetical protein